MSSDDLAIRARGLSKCYGLYDKPVDRLKQMLFRGRQYVREFWALRDVSFEVGHGEVIGIVGRNGAGKSTLLQLICGTLTETSGSVEVNGRVAALLELGAGFNPEFTGRENIRFYGSLLGLTLDEIIAREDDIIAFADIGPFIDQPVKTYSSGMFVRLAFSVAISIDPDILIVDEALSVGDGIFSRKSFERIMALKDAGKTILFCSHSMYQIEVLCNRALWLEKGEMRAFGDASAVIQAYSSFLDEQSGRDAPPVMPVLAPPGAPEGAPAAAPAAGDAADGAEGAITDQGAEGAGEKRVHFVNSINTRITGMTILIDGERDKVARSGRSRLEISLDYVADSSQHPSVGVIIQGLDGKPIASAGTINDGLVVPLGGDGRGNARLVVDPLPLLRGEYVVGVYLLCDRGLFAYEALTEAARFRVEQTGVELGVVNLSHQWVLSEG